MSPRPLAPSDAPAGRRHGGPARSTPLLARLNPLRCTGTALPPNLLLAAKLIVVCLILKDYLAKIPEPFLPLLPIFDAIPEPALFRDLLRAAFLAGAAGLLLNLAVRTSALVAGLVVLLGPLTARGIYTNGDFFSASMLLLIGLYHARHGVWLVRAQFVVMYLGSALNKLFEPDWHDGRYMEYWLVHLRESRAYIEMASWFPPGALSTSMGWATIATELTLAAGLALPRLYRPAIWLALFFHSSSLFLAHNDFGIFLSVLFASFLAFARWPEPGTVHVAYAPTHPMARLLPRLSRLVHFDGLFRWTPVHQAQAATILDLRLGDRTYAGLSAFNVWLLLNPLLYFGLAVLVAWPYGQYSWIREWTVFAGLVWFFPATPHVLRFLRGAPRPARPLPLPYSAASRPAGPAGG